MALHNPSSSPLVYDTDGHQVDGHGVIPTPNLADAHTKALLDAGVLIEIPSTPADTDARKPRRTDGKDS